jgi:hypothetical protein
MSKLEVYSSLRIPNISDLSIDFFSLRISQDALLWYINNDTYIQETKAIFDFVLTLIIFVND